MSECETPEHIPQSSGDEVAYEDERGIRITTHDWTCPNCDDDGILMHRPGSKNTCANCFWVCDGTYNTHVLSDWPLLYRQGQQLLAAHNEPWHGSPGDVATRLRTLFDTTDAALTALQEHRTTCEETHDTPTGESTESSTTATQLTDFV